MNEYFDENGRAPEETQVPETPKKKKSLLPLWISLGVLAALFLVAAAVLGVMGVRKIRDKILNNPGIRNEETDPITDESLNPSDETKDPTFNYGSDDINSSAQVNGFTVMDVSDVVSEAMPAVVAITDTRVYKAIQSFNPYNFFFNGGNSGGNREGVSSGSGVIIGSNESELLIVTNNHVVDLTIDSNGYNVTSKGLTVSFCDESTASAVVKGTDSDADLAVIAVNLNDLSTETKDAIRIAKMGSSDTLKIGEGVVAIGNAGGYGQSVTAGIISAKNREVTIDGVTRKLLQTDAAINPGNSGGGLFNAKAELIGINNSKTVSTSIEGMGFAIPISYAQTIIENLVNKETIPEEEQGYLGIQGETVPENFIKTYNYPEGVMITGIMQNSPVAAAGIRLHDVIVSINGKAVTTMAELKEEVNSYRAGTEIDVVYKRAADNNQFEELKTRVKLASKNVINPETEEENPTESEKEEEKDNNGSQGFDPNDFFKYFFNF